MSVLAGRRAIWLLGMVLACSSAPASKQPGSQGSSPGNGGSGNDTGTGTSATVGQGGASTTTKLQPNAGGAVNPTSGGSASGSAPIAGGNAVATGGVAAVSQQITLSKATARIGGNQGAQLFINVEGLATVGTFASIEISLADASGTPLLFFDNDWDGVIESATGRVGPTKIPTTESFSAEAVVNGVKKLNGLSQLQVALFDRTNARTAPMAVTIQQQPIVELGAACDPKSVTNRCRQGLACSGSPSLCVDGTAPTIAHAAFQRANDGPFIRVDGVDPDEDVIIVRVDFLSSSDAPIMVDLDGDDVLDADHLEVTVGITNQNGGYLFVIQSGLNFETLVPRLGLTAIDSKGNESATQRVSISTQITRAAGQSCDLAGFTGCVAGTSCIPTTTGTIGTCTTFAQAESLRCSVAPVWDLSKDPPKVTGLISGYSAWEPPAGCLSTIANDRPEYVVKLHLGAATPKLVLSTAEPETLIDTGIVVLPSCAASMDTALACNDDGIGYSSQVTLTNLAAGDYFVIIEALQAGGGGFGLSASTQ